jgi:hypothetical protein
LYVVFDGPIIYKLIVTINFVNATRWIVKMLLHVADRKFET